MQLKIIFSPDTSSYVKGWYFFAFSIFILVMLITRFENPISDLPGFLSCLFIVCGAALTAFFKLKLPAVTINKNFFTIGRVNLFQQKYFWKDIKEIHRRNRRYSHVTIELTKKNTASSMVKDTKIVSIDFTDVVDEKKDILIKLLTFFKENYSYVDIHTPDIDRSEVKFFTEEMKKLGVDCEFSD